MLNGSLRLVEAKGMVVNGTDGPVERFIGINQHSPQRKQLEISLATVNQELREYATVASHDLQVPRPAISSCFDAHEPDNEFIVAVTDNARALPLIPGGAVSNLSNVFF